MTREMENRPSEGQLLLRHDGTLRLVTAGVETPESVWGPR